MNAKGNALFLILIAVALFAALSYAITTSGRGGGGIDRETRELAFAQVFQYAGAMTSAIQRLTLTGCADNQITFEDNGGASRQNSGSLYVYTNPNAPGDERCHVFSPQGGGMQGQDLPAEIMVGTDEVGAGHMHPQSTFIQPMRVLGLGSDEESAGTDIMMWMGFVQQDACMAINEKLGIPNPSNLPPSDSYSCLAPFVGNYPACSEPFGNDVTELVGHDMFCVTVGSYAGSDTYSLMKIIHIR